MVAYYGMSERLPNLNYYDMQSDGYGLTKPYSDKTAELIDQEASRIVQEEYDRAKATILAHRAGLEELAKLLLEREVIYTEDVEHIFGKRAWESRADELMRLNAESAAEQSKDGVEPAAAPEAPAASPDTDATAAQPEASTETNPPAPSDV